MPKVLRTIPETNESVTRPVIFDITRQLFKYTGLPEETPIFYPDQSAVSYQPNSTIGQQTGVNFNQGDKIFIDVEEDFDPEAVLATAVFTAENLNIFRDDALEVGIKPVYSSTKVSINFRARFEDKVSAGRWRDEIRTRVSMNREVKLLSATYHYIIPEAFLAILKEIHRLRENVAGYGEDWNTYFTKHLTEKASIATNMAGRYETWVVGETQQEIVGWFDFEGGPEKGDKVGEAETWEIAFSYKFSYDKPLECVMTYPLLIHNQVLTSRWRPTEPIYRPENIQRSYGNSRKHFAVFERDQLTKNACRHSGIAIPSWDEFLPATIPWGTYRAFTAMVALQPDSDLQTLFKMTQLGQKMLHPEILKFLPGEAPFMHKVGQSVFVLTLYRGMIPMPQGAVVMDADLTVRSVEPLDLRQGYHVRLGFVIDWKTLTEAARTRLREHAKACIEILKSTDCTLADKGLLPKPLPGTDYIPKDELDEAVDEVTKGNPSDPLTQSQTVQFNFQQTFFIEAHKAVQK